MACKRILAHELQTIGRLSNNGQFIAGSVFVRHCSSRADIEKITHTGQVFKDDDYRNVRFTNAKRFVNENWGIKLIDTIPPKECTERVVYCDGGNGPLGHPKVYINLDKPGNHICGYCGLRFVKKDGHH